MFLEIAVVIVEVFWATRDTRCRIILRINPISTGKLHRALRLSVEHIPDSKLGDIKEAEDEIPDEMSSESDQDVSREVLVDQQDGITSDDTDLEVTSE